MDATLRIGLSSWVIQDGNYADFEQGQTAAFALEFFAPEPLAAVSPDTPLERSLTYRRGNAYDLVADVAFIGRHWCVLDAGYRLFSGIDAPGDWTLGLTVRGAVEVSVDPFFYFEDFSKAPRAPPLIYDWRIDRIELETTPWVRASEAVPHRDRSRPSWRDIPRTDAWNDDGGHAEYLLTCTLLDNQRRRTLKP